MLRGLLHKFRINESKSFEAVMDYLVSDEDLKFMLATPGTTKEICNVTGHNENEAAMKLYDLYMRGLIVVTDKLPEGPKFGLARFGAFIDGILFDPRYDELGSPFLDLWTKLMEETQEAIVEYEAKNKVPVPTGFRVLPIEETINSNRILSYERASDIITGAGIVSVARCACRKHQRNCNGPSEVCLHIDDNAEYLLSRGVARQINKGEGKSILQLSEEHNLVHQTLNTDVPNVICNCCPCCCVFLRSVIYYGRKAAVCKSRFQAVIDRSKCIECGACVKSCHFGALKFENKELKLKEDDCFGCGLCTKACPKGAISLKEVRSPEAINSGKSPLSFVSLKLTKEDL